MKVKQCDIKDCIKPATRLNVEVAKYIRKINVCSEHYVAKSENKCMQIKETL